jgi:hypothetical protein
VSDSHDQDLIEDESPDDNEQIGSFWLAVTAQMWRVLGALAQTPDVPRVPSDIQSRTKYLDRHSFLRLDTVHDTIAELMGRGWVLPHGTHAWKVTPEGVKAWNIGVNNDLVLAPQRFDFDDRELVYASDEEED